VQAAVFVDKCHRGSPAFELFRQVVRLLADDGLCILEDAPWRDDDDFMKVCFRPEDHSPIVIWQSPACFRFLPRPHPNVVYVAGEEDVARARPHLREGCKIICFSLPLARDLVLLNPRLYYCDDFCSERLTDFLTTPTAAAPVWIDPADEGRIPPPHLR
jgi:hypothetical protein